jgi:hypothetical protein
MFRLIDVFRPYIIIGTEALSHVFTLKNEVKSVAAKLHYTWTPMFTKHRPWGRICQIRFPAATRSEAEATDNNHTSQMRSSMLGECWAARDTVEVGGPKMRRGTAGDAATVRDGRDAEEQSGRSRAWERKGVRNIYHASGTN